MIKLGGGGGGAHDLLVPLFDTTISNTRAPDMGSDYNFCLLGLVVHKPPGSPPGGRHEGSSILGRAQNMNMVDCMSAQDVNFLCILPCKLLYAINSRY